MKLSIIIPVYNEAPTIAEVLDRVAAVDLGNTQKEIIIVDDGSFDDTPRILREKQNIITHLHLSSLNSGKGSAIRTGLQYATGDIVLIQDADAEYDPQDYPLLIRPIIEGTADVVYGTRFWRSIPHMPLKSRLANYVLALLANVLYRAKITDEATAYKAFRSHVIKGLSLNCRRFEFCPEATAKIRKRGYSIHEVPISYSPRTKEAGKKIGWRDGLEAVYTLIKYRFVD